MSILLFKQQCYYEETLILVQKDIDAPMRHPIVLWNEANIPEHKICEFQ